MALWNYNPEQFFNQVSSGWDSLTNFVVPPTKQVARAVYKAPIMEKKTFNSVMDYDPVDLWNDIKGLRITAKNYYNDLTRGDKAVYPTPNGLPIPPPNREDEWKSLKYLAAKAEMEAKDKAK